VLTSVGGFLKYRGERFGNQNAVRPDPGLGLADHGRARAGDGDDEIPAVLPG
jgi:hypothetical protein